MKKLITITYGATCIVALLIFSIFIDLSCSELSNTNSDNSGTSTDSTEVTDEIVSETTGIKLPALSGDVPLSVPIPQDFKGQPVNARPFFDIFSWEMFIALSWPVDENYRGVPKNPKDPNTFLNMSNTTPIVWASYKNQFDLFGQGANRPSPWDSWDNAVNLCSSGNSPKHVFGTAKGATLDGGEIDEAFSMPLIDQDTNYTLFEMRYNKAQYDFIRGKDEDSNSWFYLRKNLVKYLIANNDSLVMPASSAPDTYGALMVKAAWKELTAKDDESLYYVINEEVYDPVTKTCSPKKMGLVGLHLVQKLDGFSQWIWSSFEHRNNIPGQGAQQPYSYNNGTDTPSTRGGWANRPNSAKMVPDKSSRVPVQVTRFNEIPTTPTDSSTVDINKAYQEKLKNTVWKNYQLVITQWPTDENSFIIYGNRNGIYPTASGQPFPVNGCTNTVAETYFQAPNDATGKGGNSCMSCHYQTSSTDFSWSLNLKAH